MRVFALSSLPLRWLLLCCVIVTSGCGFHLRDDSALPPALQAVYLDGAERWPHLSNAVAIALAERGGADVSAELAKVRVNLLDESYQRRVVSINRQGQASEYELTYVVRYRVEEAAERQITRRRIYVFDPTNPLAGEAEAEQRVIQMRREAARQLVRHLAATLDGSTGQP